ncbi:MAG: HlyC/CorC family transporter [Oscillospiraceae bacterium]|nr:HlyC/CorC family transporter [Oscillospiraceae bacterium]
MDPDACQIIIFVLMSAIGIFDAYIVRRSEQTAKVPPEMWDEDKDIAGSRETWFSLGISRAVNALFIIALLIAGCIYSLHVCPDRCLPYCAAYLIAAVILYAVICRKGKEASAEEICRRIRSDSFYTGFCRLMNRVLSRLYNNCTDPAVGEEDVMQLVDEGSEDGGIEKSERDMIDHVFRFHDMPVENVMTHRTDVVAVDAEAPVTDVVYRAIDTGFSRIPVYRDSIDHIIGVICVKDLLTLVGMPAADVKAETYMRDVEYIPRSCVCDDVFRIFTEKQIQMAVVVDEYGGTYGVVTMEDLVELVFGSIRDEYDDEEDEITEISDGVWMIDGSAGAAQTMEILGEPLPEDTEYDTMAAFVTSLVGHIPQDGETPSAKYKTLIFTVLVTEDMRIGRIKAVRTDG